MAELQMGAVESQFADMIWELEPVHSRELVRLAEEKLQWKKSTTYTVLRRLCDKGIFENENCIVTEISKQFSAVSRYVMQNFISKNFFL